MLVFRPVLDLVTWRLYGQPAATPGESPVVRPTPLSAVISSGGEKDKKGKKQDDCVESQSSALSTQQVKCKTSTGEKDKKGKKQDDSVESQSSAMVVGDKSCGSGITEKGNKQADNAKECQLLFEKKVNMEDFITAVEGHPSIWDVSCDDYSNKHVKLNAWNEIITSFIEDFDERPLAEKNTLSLFELDAKTGAMRTAKALTGKGRSDPYSLTVRALDNGQPSLFTDVTLKLFIGDVVSNDGIPSFIHPTLDEMAYISE
ncbi:hypothetical protein J6590_106998, partial [Homalodisca vitripennis]